MKMRSRVSGPHSSLLGSNASGHSFHGLDCPVAVGIMFCHDHEDDGPAILVYDAAVIIQAAQLAGLVCNSRFRQCCWETFGVRLAFQVGKHDFILLVTDALVIVDTLENISQIFILRVVYKKEQIY